MDKYKGIPKNGEWGGGEGSNKKQEIPKSLPDKELKFIKYKIYSSTQLLKTFIMENFIHKKNGIV